MHNGTAPQPRILVVDPQGSRRDSVVSMLQSHGYAVAAVGEFADARRALAQEPLDLLITELRLGPYNGLHLVLSGRGNHPEMPAIVTGQPGDDALAAESSRCGASYLAGPPSEQELIRSVREALDGSPPQG